MPASVNVIPSSSGPSCGIYERNSLERDLSRVEKSLRRLYE